MNNAELIKALRYCAEHEACDHDASAECPYWHHWIEGEDCAGMLAADAADALEAAEKRIATVEEERDLERFAAKNYLDKIDELKAQIPKDGEWISNYDGFEYDVRCSVCGAEALIKEGGSHDHAYSRFCPNCGAKMDGKENADE